MTSISFPHLSDVVIHLSKTLPFTFFGIPIAVYGCIIALGLVTATIYGFARSPQFGVSRNTVWTFLLIAIPVCYLGARVYYIVYTWDYYSQNPMQMFNLKGGGMAIYGTVIAGALTVVIFCRVHKLDVLSALDLGAICLLIGQAIGRWGNFVNGEAHGYSCCRRCRSWRWTARTTAAASLSTSPGCRRIRR